MRHVYTSLVNAILNSANTNNRERDRWRNSSATLTAIGISLLLRGKDEKRVIPLRNPLRIEV